MSYVPEKWEGPIAREIGSPTLGPDIDHDPVHAPRHYRQLPGGIEVIDITENLDFCLGNVVKYVLRADHKGEPVQDLEKGLWYLTRAIERRKREQGR